MIYGFSVVNEIDKLFADSIPIFKNDNDKLTVLPKITGFSSKGLLKLLRKLILIAG